MQHLGACLPHCSADCCMAHSNQSMEAQARTSCAVYKSRPDVGSSRNSTRGSVIMAMPMFVRFAWQVEARSSNERAGAPTQKFGPALLHVTSCYAGHVLFSVLQQLYLHLHNNGRPLVSAGVLTCRMRSFAHLLCFHKV